MTGGTAVERGVKINAELETAILLIKTDSKPGSNDALKVDFWTQGDDTAGGFHVSFGLSPTFRISWCTNWANLPTNLPAVNIWRVTVIKTPDIRVQIICNEIEITNQLISESECTDTSDQSVKYWSRDVAKISFSVDDTASDFYDFVPYTSKQD